MLTLRKKTLLDTTRMAEAASCCWGVGCFSTSWGQGDWSGLNKNGIEQSNENLVQSTQNLRLDQRFTCQQDNDPEHAFKEQRSDFGELGNWKFFEWLSQSPDLNPTKPNSYNIYSSTCTVGFMLALDNFCQKVTTDLWQEPHRAAMVKVISDSKRRLL